MSGAWAAISLFPQMTDEFWHTGNPVPLHTGDYRSKRPEEWVWSAARGASAGKGTSSHEGWHAYTVRMIHSHVFKYKCNINALYNIRNMHVGIYRCTVKKSKDFLPRDHTMVTRGARDSLLYRPNPARARCG